MRSAALLLLGLPCFVLPCLAQLPEDAEALLHKAAGAYRSADTWHFVASERTVTEAGDQRKETETLVLTARGEGGRTRVEFDDRASAGVAVNDGRASWVYLPRQNRYAKLPPKGSEEPAQEGAPALNSEALVRRFPDRYKLADERVVNARILRNEQVGLQSGEADCTVVEVQYNPPPGMREGSIERTFWIARDTGLIVRERSLASMAQPGQPGQKVRVTQEIDFQMALVNGGFDSGLFEFAPPPGAQRVESLRPDAEPTETIDAVAPDFTLQDLGGGSVQLSSLRGKVVLLDFWASWCGPCRYDMPIVEQLHKERAADGLAVYGVNAEAAERARAYLAGNALSFPTLVDRGMEVAGLYRVRAIPTFVVIDRQGRVSAYLRGTQSRQQLEQALEKAGL
ncbi:MAG: redoxin domain-containing protein [Acidobacteria bacterium]|nr:redoxin domain-containing protein [Acidobacteriota bacterium]